MANSTDMMTWSQVTKTLHCINRPVLWDAFVGMFCRKELVPSLGSYKFRDTVLIPLPLYSIDTYSRNHICRYDFSDAGDGIIRPGSRGSIPCLLMHCLFMSPVQQQACYWLWKTDNMYCCFRVNIMYLGTAKFEIGFTMRIYFTIIEKKFSMLRVSRKFIRWQNIFQMLMPPETNSAVPYVERFGWN